MCMFRHCKFSLEFSIFPIADCFYAHTRAFVYLILSYLQWKYVSDVIGHNTAGKSLFTIVPAWLMVTHFLRYPKTNGLRNIEQFHIFKYFLPTNHRLYECRSLLDCLESTPKLLHLDALRSQNFHPQPSRDGFLNMSDIGCRLLKMITFTVVRDFTGWFIGKILAYPLKRIYARCASTPPHSHPANTTRSHPSLLPLSRMPSPTPVASFILNMISPYSFLSVLIVSPLTLTAIFLFILFFNFLFRNIPQAGSTPLWRTMSIASRANCKRRPITAFTVASCIVYRSLYTNILVHMYIFLLTA